MIAYQTNDDGYYLGPVEADKSPLEEDVFLIPAGCVLLAPPQFDANTHRCRWDGEQWQLDLVPLPEPEPEPDPVDPIRVASQAIQAHMDTKAREREYDSIHTAISYRDDPNPKFAAEAEDLFNWRSAVWTAALSILHDVEQGNRPVPSTEELIAELPTLVWSVE